MTIRPAIWRPIAIVVSAVNLAGVGFAAATAEGWHAAGHAALALAFGVWADRLGRRRGAGEARFEGSDARLDALEGHVEALRHELAETQERLDFAERVLAQRADGHQIGPER
jgi:hypothetical protein